MSTYSVVFNFYLIMTIITTKRMKKKTKKNIDDNNDVICRKNVLICRRNILSYNNYRELKSIPEYCASDSGCI